jgi:predicted exporter
MAASPTGPHLSHQASRPDPADEQDERDTQRAMLPAWAVVAIWAVLLGLLVAMDAGFGNNSVVLEVSGSAAGLVLLLAGVVWLDRRLRPSRDWLQYAARSGGIFLLAVTAAVGWLSLAFGAWVLMIAIVPLVAAVGVEISARRRS